MSRKADREDPPQWEPLLCGIACSLQGSKTKSGSYRIDLLPANVCKQNVTRFPYGFARDIARI